MQGNWAGRATGNSIDFQDNRAYQWGDDPRAIHWAAYARTGQLSMKLYRAELSPVAEVVLDVSASMTAFPERAAAAESLLLFCVLSAARAGAHVRLHAVSGARSAPIDREDVLSGRWRDHLPEDPGDEAMPLLPFKRKGGLNVFISDLLYPGEPSTLLDRLAACGGLSIVLAPTLPEEAACRETGNVSLKNCESNRVRRQYLTEAIARRYARAYEAHFEQWRLACVHRRILFSRIPCHLPLAQALAAEAFGRGAVEAA